MPEHNTLTGADLHEPKGVATANLGQIYIADGAGSGTWLDNGWNTHGLMHITGNSTAEVTPTAVDPTLATDSDYTKVITGWAAGHVEGITFNTDELVVPVAGEYELQGWANIQLPTTSQKVALKFAINDSTPYSTQKLIGTVAGANDIVNLAGSSIVTLSATNTISLYIATDKAGDPTILEAGVLLKLLDPS